MLKEKYCLLKSPLPSQNRPKGGGWYYYTAESSNWVQNKNVQFQNNASTSTSKFHCAGSASNGKYFFYNSKGGTCHQQFRTGSTNKDCNSSACASNNKKIIYKKHSKCTISRRTSLLHSCLGKITLGHETLSTVNGYKIQGYSPPFLEKILQLTKMSKE